MDEPDLPAARPRIRGRLVALDVALAVLLGFVQIQIAGNMLKDRPDFTAAFMAACLTATVLAATIAVRRRWPVQALAAALVVWAAATVSGAPWGPYAGVALVLYVVAVGEPPARSVRALVLCLAGAAVAISIDPYHGAAFAVWWTGGAWLLLGLTWLLGHLVRTRRLGALRAERERAHRILVDERLRIARELHDVVTHGMGLIAVQASVANHIAEARPEEARKALRDIEATSRGSLTEMRRLLGVLRDEPGAAADGPDGPDGADARSGAAPQPGVADLPGLVARVADAGVRVELAITGAYDLPEAVQLTVYRIVQEAVTNVVKHAAPAHCAATVEAGGGEVRIEVTDDGASRGPARAGGHGLVGMRERVAMYGGGFTAGPRPGGGFAVTATLPYGREGA